ncbi:MAG: DNA-binding response regulator [Desulfuromonadaceae bacterium GWB2_53_15]|nr:MAG: DNA-binding response regulator [Desulfuromonadaceae bacterium GWB2_53_15]
MFNILIVDDHAVVRRGLKEIILETVSRDVGFDEAASGREALQKTSNNNYDLVLLDISMPGRNGLDTLKAIKAEKPDLPVLVLSMYPEEQFAMRSFKAGASGYITKESAPEELQVAVNKILHGRKYISSYCSEMLLSELKNKKATSESPHMILSNREYHVACLIASGKSLKEIALELVLSDKTISTYRSRILNKMNLKTNAELINYAIKHNMVNID